MLRDGDVLYRLRPKDGVYDSLTESFDVALPEVPAGESLRGQDAAGNRVEIPLAP